MKLRLKAFRKSTMKSLVIINPKGGAVTWDKIGAVSHELEEGFGHSLLSSCGDMLEVFKEAATKVIHEAPKNKVVEPQAKKARG
jgi:hypothetical protein